MSGTFVAHDKKRLIQWMVCLLVPLLIWLTPVDESIHYTAGLRMFFVITSFGILLLAFDFFDALIPAVFLSTAYFLSGIAPFNVAFGSWTTSMVWMIIGALLFASILEECGLLTRIALWCVKKCGGTYNGALYGIFLSGLIVNFLTFGNAYIIMLTLGFGICKAMRLEVSRESAIVCVVTILGALTPCCFIYNPVYITIASSAISSVAPSFAIQWYDVPIYLGIIMIPACLFIIWLITKIFHTSGIAFEGGADFFEEEFRRLGPLSLREKKAICGVVLLVAYLFTSPLTHLPPDYGFMVIPYLYFLPGINVAGPKSCKNMNWSAIFFMASCLCIGMVSGYLGAPKFISSTITPALQGHGVFFAVCCMLLFGTLANLFMTPYAMMAALVLPFVSLGLELGMAPIAALMILQLATDMIFLPYEAAAPLVMYGFGYMPMKDFIILSSIKCAVVTLVFVAVIYPFWSFLGFFA